jgi:hypothetical protein
MDRHKVHIKKIKNTINKFLIQWTF